MKWAVLAFNVITVAVLGYVIYTQIDELSYYAGIEDAAVKAGVVVKAAVEVAEEATGETTPAAAEEPAQETDSEESAE